jgi:hypothetical protein
MLKRIVILPFRYVPVNAIMDLLITEVRMEPKTISVPQAGEWLGLGRNAAYEAARRGDIPTIKIGRLLRVPVVALERKLEEAGRQ